jgi:hypothetical protein
LDDLGIEGRLYANGSYRNRVGSCGLDPSDSREGPMADLYEHDNETSGSIKTGKFLD